MRAVLKMDLGKKRKEDERNEFKELVREYMKFKPTERSQEISINDFDCFSEDNNYCYDGITPSYKAYYEKKEPFTIDKYQELQFDDAYYDVLDGVFKTRYIVSEYYDYMQAATVKQKASMEFTYKMLNAFLHKADKDLRKFLRKPDNSRKMLTNQAKEFYENAKKYCRLVAELRKIYFVTVEAEDCIRRLCLEERLE
jgi:hypothetical protein